MNKEYLMAVLSAYSTQYIVSLLFGRLTNAGYRKVQRWKRGIYFPSSEDQILIEKFIQNEKQKQN